MCSYILGIGGDRHRRNAYQNILIKLLLGVCFISMPACTKQESNYEPCDRIYKTDPLWPSRISLDWIPYTQNEKLIFKSSTGKVLSFEILDHLLIKEEALTLLNIICPQDSAKLSLVESSRFSYNTVLKNNDDRHPLANIEIKLAVVINEKYVNLDKLKLADLLILSVNRDQRGFEELFRYAVLDRGFIDAVHSGFTTYDSLVLGSKKYFNVVSNTEHPTQLTVYYSMEGMIGLEFDSVLYTLK